MVHFGFSYVGVIYLLMLFIPNIFWAKNQPKDYDKYVGNEKKSLLLFERAGEVLTSALCLIFSDFNIRTDSLWCLWLPLSFIFMVLYELYWIRYFRSEKTMADMYSSFAGFPVAGASLPCLGFFTLGVYGTNIFLILASIILSIGHIGIHLMHRKESVEAKKPNKAVKVVKILLLILITAILLVIVIAIGGRNFNWFTHYIDTSKGVNESIYVPIGGQEQYLLIRGKDKSNPVILYIHGGPAGPDSPISPVFTDPLIDDYTIVCWDQRGCGRTYFRNCDDDPDNKTVSFDQALKDTDELVDYLRGRFNTDKVILMCHSYGTIVGTRYVQQHSEKVEAYIGIGQFVSYRRSNEISYNEAVEIARSTGKDTSKLDSLYNAYLNSDSLSDYLAFRKEANKYHPAERKANTLMLAMFSPYTGMDDLRWLLKQKDLDDFSELEKPLLELAASYDIYEQDMHYDVPMYFISGEMDYVCNTSLVGTFYQEITAPEVEFVVISGGGHTPHYESPKLFADAVRGLLQHS